MRLQCVTTWSFVCLCFVLDQWIRLLFRSCARDCDRRLPGHDYMSPATVATHPDITQCTQTYKIGNENGGNWDELKTSAKQ